MPACGWVNIFDACSSEWPLGQRQKPLTNRLSKLVNANLPAEAKTPVVEARGSHRVSLCKYMVKFTTAEALRRCIFFLLANAKFFYY